MIMKRTFRRILLTVLAALAAAAPAAGADSQSRDRRVTPVVRAYRKVGPAVVNISTTKLVRARFGLFGRDPFESIFAPPRRRKVPVHSLGSGFLIHPAGYIVTNAHVVRQAEKIDVVMTDKARHEARVISADPGHDLAVLKIDPPRGTALPRLALGRSDDLMVGETVIAVGNPLGYANTVTTGVVSALGRVLEFEGGVRYTNLIQTDAPINPGSSGGPLLNIDGEIIGINTAISSKGQNIGFAIPVDALADELTRLLDLERINRVVFGASVRRRHGSGGDELVVTAVRPGTPAAGKLRTGDRVLAVDGQPMRQIADYICAMIQLQPDATVRLRCLRDGKEIAAAVALKAKPRPDGKALAERLFGMTLRRLTPQLADDLRLPVSSGLMVVGLDEDGPARRLGLRTKDVLYQVDRYYIDTLEKLGIILEDVRPGQKVTIGVVLVRQRMRAVVNIRARGKRPRRPAGQPL